MAPIRIIGSYYLWFDCAKMIPDAHLWYNFLTFKPGAMNEQLSVWFKY
jgi:hypothetical protein